MQGKAVFQQLAEVEGKIVGFPKHQEGPDSRQFGQPSLPFERGDVFPPFEKQREQDGKKEANREEDLRIMAVQPKVEEDEAIRLHPEVFVEEDELGQNSRLEDEKNADRHGEKQNRIGEQMPEFGLLPVFPFQHLPRRDQGLGQLAVGFPVIGENGAERIETEPPDHPVKGIPFFQRPDCLPDRILNLSGKLEPQKFQGFPQGISLLQERSQPFHETGLFLNLPFLPQNSPPIFRILPCG